jgi:hypothetical protein
MPVVTGLNTVGSVLFNDGRIWATATGQYAAVFNRMASVGELVRFYDQGTQRGQIKTRADGIELAAVASNNSVYLTPTGTGEVVFGLAPSDFADDAAAAAGGVPVNGIYRTASVLKVRVA